MTINLAPSPPIKCSFCFGQQPRKRHVDFDSAIDRGYGMEGTIQIPMDEAIGCEDCVRVGAELLGMEFSKEKDRRIEDLERKLDVERKRHKQAQRLADTYQDLVEQKNIHVDHRKLPRKELEIA